MPKKNAKKTSSKAATVQPTKKLTIQDCCAADNCYEYKEPGQDYCGHHLNALVAHVEKTKAARKAARNAETKEAAPAAKKSRKTKKAGAAPSAPETSIVPNPKTTPRRGPKKAAPATTEQKPRSSRELTQPIVASLQAAGWTIAAITRALGMPSAGPVHNWKTGKAGATEANLKKLEALVGTNPPAKVA